jgi:uncharacterized peroxidase-related enzyme
MAFIETTQPDHTRGAAREMLARQQAHYGYVPNYAKVFSDRPDVMDLWAALQAGIRKHVDPRRFELITFAAAHALGSSYCALAHARVLQARFLSPEELRALVDEGHSGLPEVERAMIDLARKVVADASSVDQEDIDRLRRCGLRDDEIFDVVAVAAARCFFAKLPDALGALPDVTFLEMEPWLREKLTVGRPISTEHPERMDSHPGDAVTNS